MKTSQYINLNAAPAFVCLFIIKPSFMPDWAYSDASGWFFVFIIVAGSIVSMIKQSQGD